MVESIVEPTMKEKFLQFLESRYRNTWLKPDKGKKTEVYLRKGIRRTPNSPVLQSLDIANFGAHLILAEVMEFLELAEGVKGKYDVIYLENVDQHGLVGRLVLAGYHVHELYSVRNQYVCLYKILPDPNLPS